MLNKYLVILSQAFDDARKAFHETAQSKDGYLKIAFVGLSVSVFLIMVATIAI